MNEKNEFEARARAASARRGLGTVAFIGAGNLAWSLVSGLLARDVLRPDDIRVCNRSSDERLGRFAARGVQTGRDKAALVPGASIVLLAMKPQDAAMAVAEAAPHVSPGALVISTVAGLPLSFLKAAFPAGVSLARAMPNTSSQAGASVTAVAVPAGTAPAVVEMAMATLSGVGSVHLVDESLLDAVTAVSGSGPAYFYYFVETMIKAAAEAGLDAELARNLVVETFQGAAAVLKATGADPAALRAKVTSARGTTEAALQVMAENGLPEIIRQAVSSAARRSAEITDGFKSRPAKAE
ncbi:MAG: pyrroline-5-carboxylate reductase [Bacillota bacterium]